MNARQLRARVVLAEADRLGVDLADLLAVGDLRHLPTVAAWITEIEGTFTPATARTYRPYWRLATTRLGDRRLAELTVVDLTAVVTAAGERARRSHPTGNGRSAEETCVAALRALTARAVAAGHLDSDPAAALTKPRRARSRRRALDAGEVAELADAVRITSRASLDLLLLRFHLETGARRQGALNLAIGDLDTRRGTVWLREKHGDQREQPCPRRCSQLSPPTTGSGPKRARRRCSRPPATTTPSSPDPELRSHGTPAPPCRPTAGIDRRAARGRAGTGPRDRPTADRPHGPHPQRSRRGPRAGGAAADRAHPTGLGTLECSLDEPTVRRALANLVDNAVRYAPAGSTFEVDATTTESEAIVVVTDHGPGIAETDQEHIFQRFWQGRPDTHGTGLPIAKQVAHAHGGDLTVRSPGPAGDGAAFELRLRR